MVRGGNLCAAHADALYCDYSEVASHCNGRATNNLAQPHSGRGQCTRSVGQRKMYALALRSGRDPGCSSRDQTCAHPTSALSCRQLRVVITMKEKQRCLGAQDTETVYSNDVAPRATNQPRCLRYGPFDSIREVAIRRQTYHRVFSRFTARGTTLTRHNATLSPEARGCPR
jgi:hypothetical protein